jgi:hypothetical protein
MVGGIQRLRIARSLVPLIVSAGEAVYCFLGGLVELRLAFQALVRRLEGMRPARGADSVRMQRTYTTYGPDQPWMSFDVRR